MISDLEINGKPVKNNSMCFSKNVLIQTNEICRVIQTKKESHKSKKYIVKRKLKLTKNGMYFMILTTEPKKTIVIDFLIQKKRNHISFLLMACIFVCIFFLGNKIYQNQFSQNFQKTQMPSQNDIAIWNFKVNGNQSNYQKINFADTVGKNQKEIAPGQSGKFFITIDSENTEVDLNYYLTINEEKNKPRNLYFLLDNRKYLSMKELAQEELKGEILSHEKNKQKQYCIYWNWPFESYQNNIFDEIDGKKADTYQLEFSIIGTQKENMISRK